MKITILFLLAGTLNVLALNSYSQTTVVSVDFKDVPVEQVLNEIENNSEFFFLFNQKLVDVNRKVDITAKNVQIKEILAQLFENEDVEYLVYDRQIILSPRNSVSAKLTSAQQLRVTGIVTDAITGEPIIGAYILVDGTSLGTTTNVNGNFAIEVPNPNATLTISYIGYTSEKIALAGQTWLDIRISPDITSLEEVVVIGYGTVKKKDLTGSVSTVSAKNFEKITSANPLLVLQGRTTGLQITTNSGLPGAGASVLIRGVQSINGSNSPIYVVDGMITDNINSLNPSSIESVSVLKDASASAIYGARAANGVILVTTKRGEGKKGLEISLNANYGFQTESNLKAKVLTGPQFLELFTEAYQNAGMALQWNEDDLVQYQGRDVNWKDLILQTGVIQNYDLSVSGGSDKSNYFISAGYLNHKGMVIETGHEKYMMNFNSDHKINNWIKFGNSLNLFAITTNGNGDQYANAIRKSPLAKAYEDDGDYGIINNTNLEHMFVNPIWASRNIVNKYVDKGVKGNIYVTLSLLKGLDFTARGSMDYGNRYSSGFSPAVPVHYNWEGSRINAVTKGYSETVHWTTDFLLNYNKTFLSSHNVKLMLGYSLEESQSESLSGRRTGTPTDAIQFLDAGDPTSQTNANTYSDWAFTSIFGRLNYDYRDKYLFTATLRRDGTSRLKGDNRFGSFPSFSAAWRISEESFFENISFINDLKVRASYGTLGNIMSVGVYGTTANLTSTSAVLDQAMAKGYTLTNAVNADLRWESAVKKNFGIDAQLLNSHLYTSIDYFIEDTYDLLFNEPIAYSTGLSGTPLINAGKVRNTGYELELGYRGNRSDFTYDVSVNLSHVKNEVVDLGGRDLRTSGIQEGYPVRSFFGYKANGIIRDESQLSIYDAGTFVTKDIGDIYLLDIDGYDSEGNLTGVPDGKVDAADRTIIGNRYPNLIYGALGTFGYKNWGLQIQLQGVQGIDLNFQPSGDYSLVKLMSGIARNEDAHVLDRYHPVKNPDGNWPRLMKDGKGNNAEMSEFWLADASYLRVKNINLTYNLSQKISSMLNLQGLSLFTTIQNLYTFTKYKGPEVDTTTDPTGVPQPRTYTFGLKATF